MITLLSPAKVNLFLKIVAKRNDGYHELISLFQTISLADTITIEKAMEDRISCSDTSVPTDETNTVAKALAAYRKRSTAKDAFHVAIQKRIPHGAGLGGGSSNAATALFGLNALAKEPVSERDLIDAASEVGSDVPFFLSGGTAICKGRGEIIEEVSPLKKRSLYIVMPDFTLSTPKVYGKVRVENLSGRDFPKSACEISSENYPCFNDLEAPAFELAPQLKEYKTYLSSQGYERVFMSGSGSSLVIFCSKPPALPPGCRLYSASFINRKRGYWYDTPLPL